MRAADSPGVQLRGETSLVLMGGFSHTCWEMVHSSVILLFPFFIFILYLLLLLLSQNAQLC